MSKNKLVTKLSWNLKVSRQKDLLLSQKTPKNSFSVKA